jgi:hypothetical protein
LQIHSPALSASYCACKDCICSVRHHSQVFGDCAEIPQSPSVLRRGGAVDRRCRSARPRVEVLCQTGDLTRVSLVLFMKGFKICCSLIKGAEEKTNRVMTAVWRLTGVLVSGMLGPSMLDARELFRCQGTLGYGGVFGCGPLEVVTCRRWRVPASASSCSSGSVVCSWWVPGWDGRCRSGGCAGLG